MSAFEDESYCFEQFSGRVRLFPLPNLVLFPHVMQPLHIFEPRYRDLLEDALKTDRLIAMAILAPGWEKDYEGRPPVSPMACLGRITTYCRLHDGTYNVLLLGLRRVRLIRELQPVHRYREAEVVLCDDCTAPHRASDAAALRRRLRDAFLKILPTLPEAQEQLGQFLGTDVALGVLTDVISYMLNIGLQEKESLLSQLDVYQRAELLLAHLARMAAPSGASPASAELYPPQFSAN